MSDFAQFFSFTKAYKPMGALLVCAAVLGACAEPETILPGKREPVNSVLSYYQAEQKQTIKPTRFTPPRAASVKNWPNRSGNGVFNAPAHLAFADAPTVQWQANIGKGNSRRYRTSATPVAMNGVIFTLDAANQLMATSAADGSQIWQRDLTPTGERPGDAAGGAVSADKDRIYVTTGFGQLHAIDAKTGQDIWTHNLGAPTATQATVRGGIVYLASGDNKAWAFDAKTGRIRWQQATSDQPLSSTGPSSAVVTGDLAVFGFSSAEMVAYLRQGGLQLWSSVLAGKRPAEAAKSFAAISGGPVLSGSRLYAGTLAGRLGAFDLRSGKLLWTAQEGAAGPVWPARGSLFVVNDNNELLRLDQSSGRVLWRQDLPKYVKPSPSKATNIHMHFGPILAGGYVTVVSSDGVIRRFAPQTGAPADSIPLPDGAAAAPILVDSTMYIVSQKGQLLALK